MRVCLSFVVAFCFLVISPPPSIAGDFELQGHFVEGGLAFGKTEPEAIVNFADRRVRVGIDGSFILGFHRDEEPEVELVIQHPDGGKTVRSLQIAQRDYKIQRIDGLPPKKVSPPQEVLDRISAEAALVRKARAIDSPRAWFSSGWRWPVIGRISGVFGSQRILNGKPKQPHYGIDIAAPEGTPFVAPADGIVSLAHEDMYYSGGTLMVDHGHGLASTFLHLKAIEVEVGQKVKKGERLGTVGTTGRSTGPHLDWRVNWFGKRLDAALLVPPMPADEN